MVILEKSILSPEEREYSLRFNVCAFPPDLFLVHTSSEGSVNSLLIVPHRNATDCDWPKWFINAKNYSVYKCC